MLLGSFIPDLLDFLDFAMCAGFLGDAIEHIVQLLESLKIFLSFTFRLLILFQKLIPTLHGSSQSILDGIIVGTFVKTFLRTMRHILLLRHSCLLANNATDLGTVMLRRLVVGSFFVADDTSPCLLPPRDYNGSVAVIMIGPSSRKSILDLDCCPFSIIFDLDCGQEVTPIFMSQGTIVLLIIIQLILHG